MNINMRGCPRSAEQVHHGHPRRRKAICYAHPHSSESQNEVPARIGRQERTIAIHHFKKIRGIYLRKDGLRPPLFGILNHAANQKQKNEFITRERQVEKSSGFWPKWLTKR